MGTLVLLREGHQHRMLLAAGHAPSGPDVEQPDLAAQVFGAKGLPAFERGQAKCRGWLADQRRRDLARIALQTDRQKHQQSEKQRQR